MKRGRFNKQEEQYIRDNCDIISYVEIARDINRKPEKVKEFIESKLGKDTSLRKDSEKTLSTVRTKKFWKSIEKQFASEELDMFEFHWNRIYSQFKEDVLPTEELQILDLIKLELLMGRNLEEQRRAEVTVRELTQEIEKEQQKDVDNQNFQMIANNRAQMAAMAAALNSLGKSYNDLQKSKDTIFHKLKATRDQRIKRIEAGKESFPIWLSELVTNVEKRREVGIKMEKMRVAMEKEYERLSQYHTYQDKIVDRPLLFPEVLEREEDGK